MYDSNKNQLLEIRIAEYVAVNNYYVIESNNNPIINAKALDKYLVDTIEESIESIDKAMSIKNLD